MRKILITLLLLMSVLVVLPQAAFAAGEPTVTITFDKESVAVGETVTATYEISGDGTYINVGWDWWIETEDGKTQNIIVEDNQTSLKMKDSFSITPQFGNFLSCSLWVVEDTGRGYFFDSHEIKIIGDNSKKPSVVIKLDKNKVEIGETVTATYEISGEGTYINVGWDWWIETEDGKTQNVMVEDNQTSLKMKDSFDIVPRFGNTLSCSLWVVEDTGRGYFFDSNEIEIIGDDSKKPEVVIELNKEEASIGESVTATYRVSGEGTYTNIGWDWWIETEDGRTQNVIVEDNQTSIKMEDSFGITPRFGNSLSCSLWVVEDTGRAYWFESKAISIAGYALGYDIYSIVEGQNTQISAGETSLTFRADGEFEKYLGVQVDGKTVPSKHVKAWSGSTYVELSAEYLASLPEGDHELVIVFEDGVAVTRFATVKQMPELPKTGDSSNMALYMLLMALSTVSLVGMERKRRTE